MLYRSGAQLFANRRQIAFTNLPLIIENADFDQFVAIKAEADFLQDRLGQAVLTDGNNRIECMGAGAQRAALFGGDFEHSVNLFKERILPAFRR